MRQEARPNGIRFIIPAHKGVNCDNELRDREEEKFSCFV